MSEQGDFMGRLSPEDREALQARGVTRRFGRGELAVGQNDEGGEVFFVLEGRGQATLLSADGKPVAYRDIRAGAIFGELSAIDGAPRSATVTAAETLVALSLSRAAFREMVETRPGFVWALLEHFSGQMRRMTERIFEFSTMLARERLVAELLRLAEEHAPGENAAAIVPAPSHFDLATRISTHREAVSREMSRLSSKGLVAKKQGRLLVSDVAALRGEIAHEAE